MIDLGRKALHFHAEGITVLFDHADPYRLYYLPQHPRLACHDDGRPRFELRLAADHHNHGELCFTVKLDVTQAQLDRLAERLRHELKLDAAARLEPVVAEVGRCELVVVEPETPAGPADQVSAGVLVPAARTLGSAAAVQPGDHAASFCLVLSPIDAERVAAVLHGTAPPVATGVVYRLTVRGLRPALRARITLHWRDIYRYFVKCLAREQRLYAPSLNAHVTELWRQQALRIDVDELAPNADRTTVLHLAAAQVERDVLEHLFFPTLGPRRQASPSVGATADTCAPLDNADIPYRLLPFDEQQLTTMHYPLGSAHAAWLTFAAQAHLDELVGDLAPGRAPAALIQPLTADRSTELHIDVGSAVDLAREEISSLIVQLRYGDTRAELRLDPRCPCRDFATRYRPELGTTVHYRYVVELQPPALTANGSSTVLESGELHTTSRVLRIDPRQLYRRLAVHVVAQGIAFERYPLVLCDIRAAAPTLGWSTGETLKLSAQRIEDRYLVRVAHDQPIELYLRLRYFDSQGSEIRRDYEAIAPGVVVVSNPMPDVVDVQIRRVVRLDDHLARLTVELRPNVEPGRISEHVLDHGHSTAAWTFIPQSPSQRDYQYRVTLHTRNGEAQTGNWLPGEGNRLLLGSGHTRLRRVELLLLGKPLFSLDLRAIQLRFWFEDRAAELAAATEFLIEDTRNPVRWAYPVADSARQTYRYQLTLIPREGPPRVLPPVATQDVLVIHSLSAASLQHAKEDHQRRPSSP